MELSLLDTAFVFASVIALFNGLIHGYTGFGGALLMVPLLSLLYGPVDAIGMVGIAMICGSVQLYPAAARMAAWRELGHTEGLTMAPSEGHRQIPYSRE